MTASILSQLAAALASLALLVGGSSLTSQQGKVLGAVTPEMVQTAKINSSSGSDPAVTDISPSGSGNLIVVAFYVTNTIGTVSVTDNAPSPNTYTKIYEEDGDNSHGRMYIFYAWNSRAGATKVSVSGYSFAAVFGHITEYSGVLNSADPLDLAVSRHAYQGYTSNTSFSSGSSGASVSQPNELLVGFSASIFPQASSVFSAGAGWTAVDILKGSGADTLFEHQLLSSASGSYAATGTYSPNTATAYYSGIVAFKGSDGSTPAAYPPTIVNPQSTGVSSSGATITWTTDVAANSQVEYGTTASYGLVSTLDSSQVTSHSVVLSNLSPSTSYHYRVKSTANGLTTTSSDGTFTTSAVVPPSVPVISSFTASPSSVYSGNSAVLSWSVTGNPAPTYSVSGGIGTVAGTQVSVTPSQSTTYTLTATNSQGSATAQASVTVRSSTLPAPTGVPVLYFSDLESGPKTGGENNNGAFVTIYGRNFGNSPTVKVGGGTAIVKFGPVPYLWYEKIVVQLGLAAATGNIVVSNSYGNSNSLPFTVRSGNIYFVSPSGNDSNPGSFASPFATPNKAEQVMVPGDIVYLRQGTWNVSPQTVSGGAILQIRNNEGGSAGMPKAFSGYPGETAILDGQGATHGPIIIFQVSSPVEYLVFSNLTSKNAGGPIEFTTFSSAVGQINHIRIVGMDLQCAGNCVGFASDGASVDHKVYGNDIHDNGDGGYSKAYSIYYGGEGAQSDIDIGWNSLHDNPRGKAVQLYGHLDNESISGVLIHDNLIYNNCMNGLVLGGTDGPTPNTVKDVSVYNNIIANNGGCENNFSYYGIEIANGNSQQYNLNGTTGTWRIYNNTFYNNGARHLTANGASVAGATMDVSLQPGGTASVQLNNNIIYAAPNTHGYFDFYPTGAGGAVAYMSGNHNLYYNDIAPGSQTSNNIYADPLFNDPSQFDFSLRAGSPAIGVGTNLGYGTNLGANFAGANLGNVIYYTPPPVINSFTASPASINGGGSSLLSWSQTGATVMFIDQFVNQGKVTGSSLAVSPSATTVYTLIAYNSGGQTSAQATVTVGNGVADVTPPIISNIATSNVSSSGVSITWTTDESSDSQVEYGLTAAYGQTSTVSVLSSSHLVALTSLSPGTTYHYRVISTDASGNSTASSDHTLVTSSPIPVDTIPPAAVTLSSSSITTNSASLSWTAPGNDNNTGTAASYDIRYSTSPIDSSNFTSATQATGLPSPTAAGTSQSYTLVGLSSNTTYYAALKTYDAAGNLSPVSNIISFTTSAVSTGGGGGSGSGPTYTITNFTATSLDKQIVLNWTNPIDSYFVRTLIVRKENSAPNYSSDGVKVYEGTALTFTDTSLGNNRTYYYRAYPVLVSGIYENSQAIVSAKPIAGKNQLPLPGKPKKKYSATNLIPLTTSLSITATNNQAQLLSLDTVLYLEDYINTEPTTAYFDLTVENAVKKYQCDKKLVCSGSPATTGWGNVGPSTRNTLNQSIKKYQAVPSTSGKLNLTRTLSVGMKGSDVSSLQNYLVSLGYLTADNSTGYYGNMTKAAVKQYQCVYMQICSGSEATTGWGMVGRMTRSKLSGN